MKLQAIEPRENATKDKIRGFSSLKEGWHFHEGGPPTKELLQVAVNMADRVAMSGFRSDAFPGIDGEIMITVYHDDNYLEFIFETDESVTFVKEKDKVETACEEQLTIAEAKKRLDAFEAEMKWKNLSVSSMENTTTRQGRSSRVSRSRIRQAQGYLLFLNHAFMRPTIGHVLISESIMTKGSPQPRSSFGRSKKKFYLTDAILNNIRVNPETSAMAI